jgi:hypothetical protein
LWIVVVLVEEATVAVADQVLIWRGLRERYPGGWLCVQQICEGCSCSQTTILTWLQIYPSLLGKAQDVSDIDTSQYMTCSYNPIAVHG